MLKSEKHREHMRNRAKEIATIMLISKSTIRELAKDFCVSKSTVHKDLSERLPNIDQELYKKVKVIIDYNNSQKHVRGGESTRKKYL